MINKVKLVGILMLFFTITMLNNACNKEEQIPSYIHLNNFDFVNNPDFGSISHKITEATVYVNSEILGVFSLPCDIPILKTGENEVIIDPMVTDNGIRATPNIYPFYNRFSKTINLEAGKIDTIQPTTTYNTSLSKLWLLEDFDSDNFFEDDIDANLNTAIVRTTEAADVFEGSGSGLINLTTTDNTLLAACNFDYQLPNNGTAAYIELNYKNEAPLSIGLVGIDAQGQKLSNLIVTFNPRDTWNKVYVNLTEAIQASDLSSYKVLIGAQLPNDKSSAKIWIDNIKLISY